MELDRTSPAYLDAVVKKKSQDDPKEIAIREKIASCVLRETWAQDAFEAARALQRDYMKDAVAHARDSDYVHERTQTAIKELSSMLRSSIEEGAELLEKLPRGSSGLIMTNHFGAYKLCKLSPKDDLGVDIPGYDSMYPSPMYFAALSPIAEKLGDGLYYSSEDFPGVFGTIHTNAGFIHVPPASINIEGGRTSYLIEETRRALRRHPNALIVNFPEGGTSGKYTGLTPYDLDPYKTGGYVIAAQLGIPVISVAQYFDPVHGFRLKVFEPFIPTPGDKEVFEKIATEDRARMQAWLDTKR